MPSETGGCPLLLPARFGSKLPDQEISPCVGDNPPYTYLHFHPVGIIGKVVVRWTISYPYNGAISVTYGSSAFCNCPRFYAAIYAFVWK